MLSDDPDGGAAAILSSSEPADWWQHHQGSSGNGCHLQSVHLHASSCHQLWTTGKVHITSYLPTRPK